MAIPAHVLVHSAVPVTYVEDDEAVEWVEGEPGEEGIVRTLGEGFPCVLFMPSAGGNADTTYRPRVVRQPTLLFNANYPGTLTPVLLTTESELLVSAPELAQWTGAPVQRWLLVGAAQPFGPPGTVVGVLAILRAVEG